MAFTAFKIILSSVIIAFASWLSGKRPELAGFIIALPLMTLLVLPLSYAEYQDPHNAVAFAKSILIAIPLSLTFFIPFLMADKIMDLVPPSFGFWAVYCSGLLCLTGAYFLHQFLSKIFL